MVQLVLLLPQNGRRVFIVGEPCAYYSLRLQPQWKRRRCGLGAVHPLEAHMGGSVSQSRSCRERGPSDSCSCYCREQRPSVGRHFQQVSREDQEPSPTSVGHVMPTLALGGPALPLMVLPSAVRSPPLRSPDGPIATSGPKKRSLDAVCWTSVGHVMPTRVPGGPAFRQWSRLVPCVRHIAWSNGRCRHDIPP